MTVEFEHHSGKIQISDEVIVSIAGSAALDCYGLVGMSTRTLRDGITDLLGKDRLSKGIEIRQDKDKTHLDLYIIVAYGTKISEVALNVQNKVKYTLKEVAGIDVQTVNIFVQGVRVLNT